MRWWSSMASRFLNSLGRSTCFQFFYIWISRSQLTISKKTFHIKFPFRNRIPKMLGSSETLLTQEAVLFAEISPPSRRSVASLFWQENPFTLKAFLSVSCFAFKAFCLCRIIYLARDKYLHISRKHRYCIHHPLIMWTMKTKTAQLCAQLSAQLSNIFYEKSHDEWTLFDGSSVFWCYSRD